MKRWCFVCLILVCVLASGWADPFKFLPQFRPQKIQVFWSESTDVQSETVYEYNRSGQLVKSTIMRRGTIEWYSTYEYDEKGNLVKKTNFSSNGPASFVTFVYRLNRLSEETEYLPDKTAIRLVRYEYDEAGRLFSVSTKNTPYNEKNLIWDSIQIYRYDSQNRIAEIVSYFNGALNYRTVCRYEANSLVMTTFYFEENGESVTRVVTEYTYAVVNRQERLVSVNQKSIYTHDGKEEIDHCITYTMKTEYGADGNFAVLSFYNMQNEFTGKAVIKWEKGGVPAGLLEEIFQALIWNFIGC